MLHRLVFIYLSCLTTACSLLFGKLSNDEECLQESFPARCEGDAFITCSEGLVFSVNCPEGTCNPDAPNGCVTCGNGIIEDFVGEECDDANHIDTDSCTST